MDAFLASEARQDLGALIALSPGKSLFGVLVGHKRGHRFFIEKAYPASGFGFTPRDFLRIDELFGGKVLGFFASKDLARLRVALRQPYGAGRMVLSIRKHKSAPSFEAFVVDFDGRFRVVPLPLTVEEAAP